MRTELTIKHRNILSVNEQRKISIGNRRHIHVRENKTPEILFITSFPPRECGIATYSQDLIKALSNKFNQSFDIKICALESENENHQYTTDIKYILNTDHLNAFIELAKHINDDVDIQMVIIQHEFGFFEGKERDLKLLLHAIDKPIVMAFHTVLPYPNEFLKENVQNLSAVSNSIIVMTHSSELILIRDYDIPEDKIEVIPHGTHLVPHSDKEQLKNKYNLTGKTVLSTFGLLGPGKNIETTLRALPSIIEKNPGVVFLIIGKTHPSIIKHHGEQYREMLKATVVELKLEQHVLFINQFLPLPELLEYLQLTDIYLFTSKNPNQAVSGTFSYAISCGCPVISTPIPHAREVLKNDAGIIIDFESPIQLKDAVNSLLKDERLRKNISSNGLHRMASTAWENSAIAHAMLFENISDSPISLQYTMPEVNLDHIKKLTTDFGIIQFSNINQPDIESGYTLDDNARALIAMCQHFSLTNNKSDIESIYIYFNFIKHCLQPESHFLNYVDKNRNFTPQNQSDNLADSNGRAIWALGYLISISNALPKELTKDVEEVLQCALASINQTHSTRAMAFTIIGLYYCNTKSKSVHNMKLIRELADRLVQMYRHEADPEWQWFESYLTYANSILSESLLCAWLATGESTYKEVAKSSFDFLLSKIIKENSIQVISNRGWLHKAEESAPIVIGGEQPIDVAYTILALSKFNTVFNDEGYMDKMKLSFNWFLGGNHLRQIIYNPCTGGCYDGLEDNYVNLNQGAESSISYLMARLTIEKDLRAEERMQYQLKQYCEVAI